MSATGKSSLVQLLIGPATARHMGIGVLLVTLVGAAYCAGLNVLQVGATPWLLVALWTGATILPWYLAFEANKHVLLASLPVAHKAAAFIGVLGLALLVCGGSDWALAQLFGYGGGSSGSVHVYRHLPETLAIAMLTAAASALRIADHEPPTRDGDVELPIAPEHIRLVRGAGNYAELETEHRVLLVRSTMGAMEAALSSHGFVRVSRSLMVPKDRITAVQSRGGRRLVMLADGSEHRVGSTFAAQLRRVGLASAERASAQSQGL